MLVTRFRLMFVILVILSFSSLLSVTASASTANPNSIPDSAQSTISAALGSDMQEYYVRTAGAGFTLTNSPQDLTTDFTSQGIDVKNGGERWSFALRGYGYGNALTMLRPVAPSASLNRVEYRRPALTEWYVNGPSGLEQGFTINQRPLTKSREPLTIALSLSGNLTAVVDEDGKGLSLREAAGRVRLRYAGLTACDRTGRELRSWLQLEGRNLLLRVDDAGAQYPVVIDPTVQLGKLTASDGKTGSWFGYSIAISGSTVVVGAPQATIGSNTYQGAAYVFVKPKTGWITAQQTAKLTASDGASFDYFGASISIDGSTVVVGAFDAKVGTNTGQGAAYVFVKPTAGWTNMTETAKLTASDGIMDNFFGYSVSISGSTVVAGAPHVTLGTSYDQGAAYVFVEPTGGWVSMTQTAKLTSTGLQGDQLGQSVSINGSTVAAGAPYVAIGGNYAEGAAYVFVEPTGGWVDMTQTAELTVSAGVADQYLGLSIATNGSTVIVGAPGINSFQGAAFIFAEPTGGWANMTETGELSRQ
jgi:hypothetical protein